MDHQQTGQEVRQGLHDQHSQIRVHGRGGGPRSHPAGVHHQHRDSGQYPAQPEPAARTRISLRLGAQRTPASPQAPRTKVSRQGHDSVRADHRGRDAARMRVMARGSAVPDHGTDDADNPQRHLARGLRRRRSRAERATRADSTVGGTGVSDHSGTAAETSLWAVQSVGPIEGLPCAL